MYRIVLLFAFALTACGPDTNTDPGNGGNTDAGPPPPAEPEISFTCPDSAPSIENGLNETWPIGKGVDGSDRVFHALIPAAATAGEPVGLVFSWHGVGNELSDWTANNRVDNTGDGFPFIVISPDDANMVVQGEPPGLDWDMFYSSPGDDNIDAAMFESIVGCLLADYNINKTQIYSLGFSGGAVMTNLLMARYPDLFAATAPLSGAFFSDPAQEDLLDPSGQGRQLLPSLGVDWNDLGEGQQTVLITHGGSGDSYGMFGVEVINFEDANVANVAYLTNKGRNVVDCPHTEGHSAHPAFWIPNLVRFLKDHPWHAPSPWAEAIPEPFNSAGCSFHAAATP
jgi:predicted esterase